MSSHSFLSFYRSGLSEVLLQPDGRCRIDVCSYYRQIAMSKAVSSMSLGKQARQQLSLSLFFYGNTAPPTVKTQIEEKCARTLEFPFSATRGENTANSAPS